MARRGRQQDRTIATFEFLTAVRRPGFLITTFGMPLFMAAYGGSSRFRRTSSTGPYRKPSVYGVVDSGGMLKIERTRSSRTQPEIPEDMRRAIEASGQRRSVQRAFMGSSSCSGRMATEPEARAALAERRSRDTSSFRPITSRGASSTSTARTRSIFPAAKPATRCRLHPQSACCRPRGTAEAASASSRRSPTPAVQHHPRRQVADASTAARITRIAVPMIFMVLFLLSILMTSGYLMQGTATEKENKVVEVLMASANPRRSWRASFSVLARQGCCRLRLAILCMVSGLGVVPLLMSAEVEMPWAALAMAVPLFLVSFLFYGSLMLGTGSLGSNMREAQQLSMVWSLMAALPMMMMAVLLRDPHGIVARVMTSCRSRPRR